MMHGCVFVTVFAFIAESHANPVLGNPGIRTPLQRVGASPFHFTPQQQPNQLPIGFRKPQDGRFIATSIYSSPDSIRAGFDGPGLSEIQARLSPTEGAVMNIYDQALQSCGTNDAGPEECTYDSSSPSVCVGVLSRDESTYVFSFGNEYENKCISIWDYGSDSNVREQKGILDLDVKCDSLPSEVLQSPFSAVKLNTCEVDLLTGDEADDSPSHCQEFTNAMERICQTCISQAPSFEAKDSLRTKCEAMSLQPALAQKSSHVDTITAPAVMLIAFMMGSLVTFTLWFRSRRSAPIAVEEPLL